MMDHAVLWVIFVSIAYFLPYTAWQTLLLRGFNIQVTKLHGLATSIIIGFLLWQVSIKQTSILEFIMIGLFLFYLILISLTDQWVGLIINQFTYPAFILFLFMQAVIHFHESLTYLLVSICTFTILYVISVLSRGIGGGDVKLLAVVGLVIGWPHVLLALWIATLSAIVYFGLYHLFRGSQKKIPFGPHVSVGSVAAYLWGETLIQWYLDWSL